MARLTRPYIFWDYDDYNENDKGGIGILISLPSSGRDGSSFEVTCNSSSFGVVE